MGHEDGVDLRGPAPRRVGDRLILERAGFQTLLDALRSQGYTPVGPTVRDGAIVYGDLTRVEDLSIGWTDRQEAGVYRLERRKDGALFLFACLGMSGQVGAVGSFTGAQWIWVGISAALLTAFVLTWYEGLRRVDLGTATAVLVLGFPVTFLLSVALRGSPMTLAETLGAAAIGTGVLLAIGWALAREAGGVLGRLARVVARAAR